MAIKFISDDVPMVPDKNHASTMTSATRTGTVNANKSLATLADVRRRIEALDLMIRSGSLRREIINGGRSSQAITNAVAELGERIGALTSAMAEQRLDMELSIKASLEAYLVGHGEKKTPATRRKP
jgi:hypothetical protein